MPVATNVAEDASMSDGHAVDSKKMYDQDQVQDSDDKIQDSDDKEEYSDIEDEEMPGQASTSIPTRPTRVLKDVFHAMDMLKLPMRHGAFKDLMRSYRNALFVLDAEDKQRVETVIQHDKKLQRKFGSGQTFNKMWAKCPDWILQRVKRVVPPPDLLLPIIQKLFSTYGHMKCAKSGNKLFDKQAWKKAKNIENSIKQGHLSDPTGGSLYYKIKTDQYGLPIYRCVRGTNSVEGGIHTNIIRKFGFFNASPNLTECALADYRLRHNADVGSKNRYGKTYKSHYNPWVTQVINHLEETLGMPSKASYFDPFCGSLKFRNSDLNSVNISYKSPELLRSYFNITEDRSIAKASIHANYTAIKEM
ncbi:hypothetical protein MBANPS3_007001 [Mucor bainieri]